MSTVFANKLCLNQKINNLFHLQKYNGTSNRMKETKEYRKCLNFCFELQVNLFTGADSQYDKNKFEDKN